MPTGQTQKLNPAHLARHDGPACNACPDGWAPEAGRQHRCPDCCSYNGEREGQLCPGLGAPCAYRDRLAHEAYELPNGLKVCGGCAGEACDVEDLDAAVAA